MAKKLVKFIIAAVIYTVFAVYLYLPYFQNFKLYEYFFVINAIVASLGALVLSRRWMACFSGSFFAGLIYGFGPFMLGMARFHPSAGLLVAAVPWLFCPAVFLARNRCRFLQIPLALIPFIMIIFFFELTTYFHLFAVPINARLQPADCFSLLAVLAAMRRGLTPVGFYHVPLAALIMGLAMLLKARRFGIVTLLFIGTALAFYGPLFNVSAIIWLSIPVLCCSLLIGQGTSALIYAGRADSRWILTVLLVQMSLALASLLLATRYFQTFASLGDGYARLFVQTAVMYISGTVSIGILFFITRANLRIHPLRLLVLAAAILIDIFLSARFIVDRIF